MDATSKETNLKRWNLIRRLSADLWQRWQKDYLQELQCCTRWRQTQSNLREGDIVLLKELDPGRCTWPMARITRTYPGQDDLTRVVDIFYAGRTYKRPVSKLVPRAEQSTHLPRGEDVRASGNPLPGGVTRNWN